MTAPSSFTEAYLVVWYVIAGGVLSGAWTVIGVGAGWSVYLEDVVLGVVVAAALYGIWWWVARGSRQGGSE